MFQLLHYIRTFEVIVNKKSFVWHQKKHSTDTFVTNILSTYHSVKKNTVKIIDNNNNTACGL